MDVGASHFAFGCGCYAVHNSAYKSSIHEEIIPLFHLPEHKFSVAPLNSFRLFSSQRWRSIVAVAVVCFSCRIHTLSWQFPVRLFHSIGTRVWRNDVCIHEGGKCCIFIYCRCEATEMKWIEIHHWAIERYKMTINGASTSTTTSTCSYTEHGAHFQVHRPLSVVASAGAIFRWRYRNGEWRKNIQ